MKPKILTAKIWWVGAVDWDRRLFDELIPLPDGTSYNAYLVKGTQKTALIDTVDPTMSSALIDNLVHLHIKDIDYVIINHVEQDHSGTIPKILKLFPNVTIITTPNGKNLLMNLLLIPETKIKTVEHGETLTLGDKTFEFIHTPWVHWPDTMCTYLREDKILFSCDLFGSHIAMSDLYVIDEATVYEAAKRYYAEIMMPFQKILKNNLEKLQDLKINVIAPSHGPLYNKPEFILEAYRDWVYSPPKNTVVLPYISMHGTTKKMVDYFVNSLVERGITVKQFNLVNTDVGKLAMALVDAASIIIGTPAVLVGPHPNVIYAVYLTNVLRPKLKFASIIGSYGWGCTIVKQITTMLSNLKVEFLDPVIIKGYPQENDFRALDKLADDILSKHKEHNLM